MMAICGLSLAITITLLSHVRSMAQPPPPKEISTAACPTGPSFTFSPTNPVPHETTLFKGTITSSGGTGIITYTWNFGDDSALVNSQFPNHAYPLSGVYTVVMTVSGNTCADTPTTTQVITVGFGTPAAIIYFPIIYKNYFELFPTAAVEKTAPVHGR